MPDAIDLGSRHLHAGAVDGVLRVVIDRPERRNALTIEMYHGLKKAAVLAERDPAIDVLLVNATGDHFCVGGEMGGRHEGGAGLDRETDGIDLLPFMQLERCPKIAVPIERVRATGPQARAALKRDLNRQLPAIDFAMFAASLASDEVREGFAAFVEKRPAGWTRRRE